MVVDASTAVGIGRRVGGNGNAQASSSSSSGSSHRSLDESSDKKKMRGRPLGRYVYWIDQDYPANLDESTMSTADVVEL